MPRSLVPTDMQADALRASIAFLREVERTALPDNGSRARAIRTLEFYLEPTIARPICDVLDGMPPRQR